MGRYNELRSGFECIESIKDSDIDGCPNDDRLLKLEASGSEHSGLGLRV